MDKVEAEIVVVRHEKYIYLRTVIVALFPKPLAPFLSVDLAGGVLSAGIK